MLDFYDTAREFVEVFGESDTVSDLGASLACEEADVLADLLRAGGRPGAADTLIESHAAADEPGDGHYRGDR